MTNPFEDELTPQEERIVDRTLAHLKKTGAKRFDTMQNAVAEQTGRVLTRAQFDEQICRIYLSIFREAKTRGRTLTWNQIHQEIGREPE